MGVPEDWLTTAEIARLADVALPTVSNWRRRHESFPRSERRDGQELFLLDEVAAWLDGRKIARNDLQDHELPGATYGARFRRKDLRIVPGPDIMQKEAIRQKDVLWKELSRFRGAEDIAVYADLVLGLLYLSVRERGRWSEIVGAGGREASQLLESAILERGPILFQLHRSWRSVLTDSRGVERLSEIIRIIDQVGRSADRDDSRAQQRAAEVFEYLLNRFAAAEGKRGVVVATPPSVVRVLVELIEPKPGESLLDPCSDAGSFILGAARYVEAHGGFVSDVSFAGQAILERSWSVARMNLELHDVPADLGARSGIALDEDLHAGRRFDVVMANPPFNMSGWDNGRSGGRHWRYGIPPRSNANFAWLQHILSSLDEGGRAAVVMANAALSSEQAGEGRIRAAMVEDGTVEAVIALPPQLFATTAVPVTVWLLRRSDDTWDGEMLFVDARQLGTMITRSQRDLLPDEIRWIADTVTDWRDRRNRDDYHDVQGFSASVSTQHVREHDYQLTPGRYVGTRMTTHTPTDLVPDLRRELDRLHRRAVEADANVDQQLTRADVWIP